VAIEVFFAALAPSLGLAGALEAVDEGALPIRDESNGLILWSALMTTVPYRYSDSRCGGWNLNLTTTAPYSYLGSR